MRQDINRKKQSFQLLFSPCKGLGGPLQSDHKFSVSGCHQSFSMAAFQTGPFSRINSSIVFVCAFSKNTDYVTESKVCHDCLAPFYFASVSHTRSIDYVLFLGDLSYF